MKKDKLILLLPSFKEYYPKLVIDHIGDEKEWRLTVTTPVGFSVGTLDWFITLVKKYNLEMCVKPRDGNVAIFIA